jgi:hypothetical protein
VDFGCKRYRQIAFRTTVDLWAEFRYEDKLDLRPTIEALFEGLSDSKQGCRERSHRARGRGLYTRNRRTGI